MSQIGELPAPKKKKSKLKWFILLLLLLGIGGGGFMAYKMGLADRFLGGGAAVQPAETPAGGGTIGAGGGSTRIGGTASNLSTATFDQFITNLADPAGNRYIRLIIDVEVISPEVIRELEMQNPRIRDAVLMLLSSKTYQDLASPAGKLRLKNEILDRINQVLGGPKVNRVFFTEIIVQ